MKSNYIFDIYIYIFHPYSMKIYRYSYIEIVAHAYFSSVTAASDRRHHTAPGDARTYPWPLFHWQIPGKDSLALR